MNKSLWIVLCALLLALPLVAQTAATDQKAPSGVVTLSELKVTVTVVKVDVEKRLLTVKGPEGETEEFEVDPAVKNLAQVKKGDSIVLGYHESLVWEVKKPGTASPGVTGTGGIATAKEGEKPGGVAARQVTATVTITKIDPAAPSVTLKGPGGNERTIKVKEPKNLENVKVGDMVDITYTEALAIAVEPAKK